ncbi:MAG: hypothetical protein DPW16_22500 [Chloroflexi bacterium]|nr:hypothetical protein [Chloroflexota bacterium]
MGLNYSIDLYFHIADLEEALLATASIAAPNQGHGLNLALPNEKVLHLPFTSHFKNEDIELKLGSEVKLDTTLLFPKDDSILFYASQRGNSANDSHEYPIGYIYLHIKCSEKHA